MRVVDSHDALDQTHSWVDRRYSSRRRLTKKCRIPYVGPDGATVGTTSGLTRDVSATGLGLVAPQYFEVDQPLLITLLLSEDAAKQVTGEVRYCQPVRDGWYHIGIAFAAPQDDRLEPDSDRCPPT